MPINESSPDTKPKPSKAIYLVKAPFMYYHVHMPKAMETQAENSLNLYDEFLASTSIDRLQKILARYELLKMIAGVPGDIVECGVFKGSGVYTFAKLSELLLRNQGRKIIGFDFFDTERKGTFKRKEDKSVLDLHDKKFANKDSITQNLEKLGIRNVELIAGDVAKTTREYAEKNLGFRIAMLYLDVDNYEGSLAILRNLYPLVAPGGLVVFDEYAVRGHGESDAVHEYFKSSAVELKSLSIATTPSAYLIKKSF